MMFKYKRYSTLPWTHIIIHHSATRDGITYDWNSIDQYHKETLGWMEIGYNFGVEFIENQYMICLGRSLSIVGAHTLGMNDSGIGVCLIGNYDEEHPNNQQYLILALLCAQLMTDFNIPIDNIVGHRNYANKTCPGMNFNLDYFKGSITRYLV